jgi:hypothetical protein
MVENKQQNALSALMIDTGTHQGSVCEIERVSRIFGKTLLQLVMREVAHIKNAHLGCGVAIRALAGRSVDFLEPYPQDRVPGYQHIERLA